MMPSVHAAPPRIMIVEPDGVVRAALQAGLTADGIAVMAFATARDALVALEAGAAPVVLVMAATSGVEDRLLVTHSREKWPRLSIVLTGPVSTQEIPGAYHLAAGSDAAKLSRFVRLVVARPALRSALQRRYRDARRAIRPGARQARSA